MIVSCPSCGTRYRHRRSPGEAPAAARCSCCEHVFPLSSSPRTYRVVSRPADSGGVTSTARGPVIAPGGFPGEGPPRMPIGMDDPSIAPQLDKTALDHAGASGPALVYRVEAGEVDGGVQASTRATLDGESDRTPARRDGPGAVLGTFVAALAGAAAGWWYGPRVMVMGEPRSWVLAGTALGLLVAWLGLRWTREKS